MVRFVAFVGFVAFQSSDGTNMVRMGRKGLPGAGGDYCELEVHPSFTLYLTTKLANPHYRPEVSTSVVSGPAPSKPRP